MPRRPDKEPVLLWEANLPEAPQKNKINHLTIYLQDDQERGVNISNLEDDTALYIQIFRPTVDNKIAVLPFALTREAAEALYQLLGEKLK